MEKVELFQSHSGNFSLLPVTSRESFATGWALSFNLFCEKPSNHIADANGPDLQKADRMRKIRTQPLNQGREQFRNVIVIV
jgi:hypothetical protein